MSHRLLILGLAIVSVLVLATGCAPHDRPTPTPTPRFTSDAQAYEAAEATYRAYVDALNNVDLSDPATFEEVYKWETGDALDSDKKVLTELRSSQATKRGASLITSLKREAIDAGSLTVTLEACLDVSAIEILDKSGRSLVDADRPDVQSTSVHLSIAQTSTTGLVISSINGRSGEPQC